jgi:hypothetical protein
VAHSSIHSPARLRLVTASSNASGGSETPISKTASRKKACGSLISRVSHPVSQPSRAKICWELAGTKPSSPRSGPHPSPSPLVEYKATRHRARGGASQVPAPSSPSCQRRSHIPLSRRKRQPGQLVAHTPPGNPPKPPKPVPTGSRTRKLQYPIIWKHHLWDSDRHSTPCSRPNPNIRIAQSLGLRETIKSCATPLDGGLSGVVASAFLNLDSGSFHSPFLAFPQPRETEQSVASRRCLTTTTTTYEFHSSQVVV